MCPWLCRCAVPNAQMAPQDLRLNLYIDVTLKSNIPAVQIASSLNAPQD